MRSCNIWQHTNTRVLFRQHWSSISDSFCAVHEKKTIINRRYVQVNYFQLQLLNFSFEIIGQIVEIIRVFRFEIMARLSRKEIELT